jgi:hypothetical protein
MVVWEEQLDGLSPINMMLPLRRRSLANACPGSLGHKKTFSSCGPARVSDSVLDPLPPQIVLRAVCCALLRRLCPLNFDLTVPTQGSRLTLL